MPRKTRAPAPPLTTPPAPKKRVYKARVTWRGREPFTQNYKEIASQGHYESETRTGMEGTLSSIVATALEVAQTNADIEVTFRITLD